MPRPEPFDNAAWERALKRVREEHQAAIQWLPGAIEWACSCGAGSEVSGGYRTEAQVSSYKDRHLKAWVRRYFREEVARGSDMANPD